MPLRFSKIALSFFGVLLLSVPALAKPDFPGVITRQLALDYEPPCSVCHLTSKTGAPTVTTQFGYALKARGFTDKGSLSAALTRLDSDRADSDGDGVEDVVELKNATDPNSKTNASLKEVADPSFGCATAMGRRPSSPGPGGVAACAAALGLAWLSKRARR
jgi:hypothetical protein